MPGAQETLAEVRRVLAETPPAEAFVQSKLHEGYRIARTTGSDYGGVEQRWLAGSA